MMENKSISVTSYIRRWHYKEFWLQLLTVLVTEVEAVAKELNKRHWKSLKQMCFSETGDHFKLAGLTGGQSIIPGRCLHYYEWYLLALLTSRHSS